MATKPGTPAASAATPPDGTTPEPIPTTVTATPTITFYKQLADEFMKELDEIAPIIPQLEAAHISTVNFVRSHLNVPVKFLATAIAAVEQTPALQAVNKLDVLAGRDTLQFIEAFLPVLDKVSGFTNVLKFTIASRKASLAADSLQIYDIAKGLARDPGSAAIASVVANMKRDLGKRGRPKLAAALRKAASAVTTAPPAEASS
jgi:hypothetical protein